MSKKPIKVSCSSLFFALVLFMYGCVSNPDTPVTNSPPNEGGISEIRPEETAHVKSLISDTAVEWVDEIDSIIARGAIQSSLARIFGNPDAQNTDDADSGVQEFKQDFPRVISLLLANGKPENGGMTYRPEPRVCREILAKNNPASCEEAMGRVTFFHTSAHQLTGTIVVKFDNFVPFIVEYSSNSFNLKLSAENLRAVIVEIDKIEQRNGGEAMEVIPELSGALTISFNQVSAAQIEFSIMIDRALHAHFDVYEGSVDINLASSGSVQLVLNKVLHLISAELDVRAIDAKFPVNNQNDEGAKINHIGLEANGIAGKITWDDLTEKIIFENIKMGNVSPWRLTVDDDPALEASFESIGIVLATSGEKLHAKATLPISFNAQLFQSNLTNGEGSLAISMLANTELEISQVWDNGTSDAFFTVLAGQVHIQGTGDLLGELLRLPGEMFSDNDNPESNFPFVPLE
ncbi:MAG: hypothetical protein A2X86_20140 [Bdellovibrionales bacterium GWA2_49_15]|nr:MAG: hypothetical protein A2X86_20140 [Bdellovibrionales bacterium GWA2_49_15]HAZ11377.1 hypothetical protein [Bdellovibrionales bacterium]